MAIDISLSLLGYLQENASIEVQFPIQGMDRDDYMGEKVRLLTGKKSKLVGVICLLAAVFLSCGISWANTVSYQYDDLYRLKRVERSDGTVIVYYYDEAGNRSRKEVTVNAISPKALFSATPGSGTPLSVTFQDQSTGTIISWLWNFGDDATSTAKNPSHTYQNAGTYTVSLTVTGNGTSDTATNYITVQNSDIADTDNDGIDDNWESDHFGNLTTATATSDFDKDGYSDRQEYLNYMAGLLDPSGNVYNPKTINAPGGPGYYPVAPGRVPDTGQTKFYNADGAEITCPASGQPFYGQDAQYNINPQSFTKLDANGGDLPDSAPSWVMVRDNVTGLIWEMKNSKDWVQDYNNLNDADNTYTWYDPTDPNPGTSGVGTDTKDFIDALNSAHFGGYSDWRLPTIKELEYIVDHDIPGPGPTINNNYFSNTKESFYWSSTTNTYDTNYAWGYTFDFGFSYFTYKSNGFYVRAVRGGQSQSVYVNNANGTVTDTSTGLVWQQETPDDVKTWEQALSYCENLSLAGYTDWRLPTTRELLSLIDYSRYSPAINTAVFPDTALSLYWSSTTHANDAKYAWYTQFDDGQSYGYDKSYSLFVRSVRGGQIGSPNALFSATPLAGTVPLSVQFTDQSIGTVSSWSWDFGDGTTSTEQNPSHTYQNAGIYTVSLAISGNGASDTISKSSYIIVQAAIVDTDNDGIDDVWEIAHFGNLTSATATSDFDKDGYSDRQEYLNYMAGLIDPSGDVYDPKTVNAPGGTGYSPPASGRVPDTGQTKCYDDVSNEITCPASGQPFFGQDAQYNINPQSFTKLDANGGDLPDSAPSWVMVRDNVTGLIWENKTDDGSVHDKDNVYTWYDSNPDTNGGNAGTPGTVTDTEDFIKALNDAQFGGYSDWRLPTFNELMFITDRGRFNPAINTNYFTNTVSSWYWSSTTYAYYPAYAWGVNFSTGYADGGSGKNGSLYVRAVRGGQPDITSNFTDNSDGTVTDSVTGLMWRQEAIGDKNWEQALAYCEDSFAGYHDWRLPTVHELKSLADYGKRNPSIDTVAFPDTPATFYWSSTTYVNNTPGYAWGVSFYDGCLNRDSKGSNLYLRPVRVASSTTLNNPPNTPSLPSPATQTIGVSVTAQLSWTGGDPDAVDTVNYDVYFGTSVTPTLVASNLSAASYNPGTLNNGSTYYWKIVARDSQGAETIGPIWNFTTIQIGMYTLSGHFFDADGNGVCGASISLYNNTGLSGYATTGADGSYSLPAIAGTYNISVNYYPMPAMPGGVSCPADAPTYPNYMQYFNEPVVISGDTVKNFSLPQVYTVSGRLLDQNGNGVGNASVSFQNPSNPIIYSTTTAPDGSYSIILYAGTYDVNFSKDGVSFIGVQGLVVNGDMSGQNFDWGVTIIIRNIHGTAYRENGTPITGESVRIEVYLGDPCINESAAWADTSVSDGTYTITGLPDGTWYAQAGRQSKYYSEWYGANGSNCQNAAPIDFILTVFNGINFSLTPFKKGDFNADRNVDLADTILGLNIVSGMSPNGIDLSGDVNGDRKIGIEDVLYILQAIGGLH